MNSAVLATSFAESPLTLDDVSLDDTSETQGSLSVISEIDYLLLNIGGQSFKISNSTISRLPQTSLFYQLKFGITENGVCSNSRILETRSFCVLPGSKEYFFDRSPEIFEYVQAYCCTGHVHCPDPAIARELETELQFWGLESVDIEMCCKSSMDDLGNYEVGVVQEPKTPGYGMRKMTLRQIMSAEPKWKEARRRATRQCCARVLTGFSVFFLLLSIVNMVLSTEPLLQSNRCWFNEQSGSRSALSLSITANSSFDGVTGSHNSNDSLHDNFINDSGRHPSPNYQSDHAANQMLLVNHTSTLESGINCSAVSRKYLHVSCINSEFIFDLIETICMAWFTLEYLVRLASADCRLSFLKDPLNILDLVATIPFYIEIVLDFMTPVCHQYDKLNSLLGALKVIRVFRVIKLARYFRALRIFGTTLAGSKRELASIAVFTSVTVVIFSSIIYYVERDDPDTLYVSIPASFWWTIVTLTTVGYGDMSPRTVGGKIVGAVACVTGILILAFPVSILNKHFLSAYRKETPAEFPASGAAVVLEGHRKQEADTMKVPVAQYVNCDDSRSGEDESSEATVSFYLHEDQLNGPVPRRFERF